MELRSPTLHFFARLSYRDGAALAATCRAWRSLEASPCLWAAPDHRRIDPSDAASLAPRCSAHLRRLRLAGCAAADAAPFLRATNLRSLRLSAYRDLTDAALTVLAARHARLEELHVEAPDPLDRVSRDALRHVAGDQASCRVGTRRRRRRNIPVSIEQAREGLLIHCRDMWAVAGLVGLVRLSPYGTNGIF